MLGRHVYRVTPLDNSEWNVAKDGETTARGRRSTRTAATQYAWAIAGADLPSKVVVEERSGAIVDERLFGTDPVLDLDRAPREGEPRSRR